MEEVPGIPGSMPSLAVYPAREIQSSLPPEEWQACLDTWIFCLEFRLRLTSEHFSFFKLSQDASGLPFLLTYLRNVDGMTNVEQSHPAANVRESKLRSLCLLLTRRLLLATQMPLDCQAGKLFELLSRTSIFYCKSLVWRDTLQHTGKRAHAELVAAIEVCKSSLLREFPGTAPHDLANAVAVSRVLPETGLIFMIGSDYLESLMEGYLELPKLTTEHAFLCFRSLMSGDTLQPSLLLDHLYALKASADKSQSVAPNVPTLLSSLLVSTSFLRLLDNHLSILQLKRGQVLLQTLQRYREQNLHLHPSPSIPKRKDTKGKAKAKSNGEEMHMHKAGQVSQIHELFPDLSTSYIMRLLDHFHDDVEAATAGLLEPDSLPTQLAEESFSVEGNGLSASDRSSVSKVGPTQLPQRKNVFDNDEFDNLRIPSGRVHMGRRDILNDAVPTLDEHAKSKAAILSALAAFDSDDDERDDTYDVADVGGNVDDTVDTDSRDTNEEHLFRAWRDQLHLFDRDSKTRLSQPRVQLKRDTGMTDEQIEGWAIMLNRDKNMQNRLKQKYHAATSFKGDQNVMRSTKWKQRLSDSEDDGSSDQAGRRTEHTQMRGGRPFGSRGGGNTAGPADAPSTQAARKRKEQGRGRGGPSHGRREGRAKKMGRGMASLG